MSFWDGMRNVFSTKVKVTEPEVDGKPVTMDAWLMPSVPDWEHVPLLTDGPFRLIRGNGQDLYGYAEGTLDEVLMLFHRFHSPRRDETCVIVDRYCNAMIAWTHYEGQFLWFGCKKVFEVYAIFNPVDAAIHEVQAAEYRRLSLGEEMPHAFR